MNGGRAMAVCTGGLETEVGADGPFQAGHLGASQAVPAPVEPWPRPIRARTRSRRTCFRRPEAYTATLSGAVSAGSNPAGGTVQRHKFEHLDNLVRIKARAPDLRQCSAVSGPCARYAPGRQPPAR